MTTHWGVDGGAVKGAASGRRMDGCRPGHVCGNGQNLCSGGHGLGTLSVHAVQRIPVRDAAGAMPRCMWQCGKREVGIEVRKCNEEAHVLLIDDMPGMLRSLVSLMRAQRWRVSVATDGRQG